jgi:hypothetical protein
MSYSNPTTISYSLGNQDFGASDDNYVIKGPNNKFGRVREICGLVTEVFTATTTAASVKVGTAADPDAYAILTFATDAVDDVLCASAGTQGATRGVNLLEIPASSTGAEVHVDTVATTGGSPTGQAEVTVTIDWY